MHDDLRASKRNYVQLLIRDKGSEGLKEDKDFLAFRYDLFELEHKTGFLGFSVLRDTMKFLNLSRFLTVNEELR
ncbi:hypothetical protein SDJN02_09253, partial [Cucurbita argyrosperma subsp. argyrosperma]